ncbi:ribosomal-processing cysteine protease Prp [Oceanobacillus halotolerans]|uniref:ribosomal-processing cysteine protease Prp n=1 Tax=Oceanobacillus halotolerans TaxID=2663380 RepID=UPI0013DD03ED|nr:ribosomal-processing cysteine protease Prp [Oceanobacillus halotolerans]
MIHVTVKRSNRHIHSFELSGHAESGPYGYDLVCAGVSAVTFGAVNAVMELSNANLTIDQGEDGGYLHVTIPSTISEEQMEKVQLLFEGMLLSLKTIEREYSQFIKIHEGGGM